MPTFLSKGHTLVYSRLTPQILELTHCRSTYLIFTPERFWYVSPESRPGNCPKKIFENTKLDRTIEQQTRSLYSIYP